MRLWLYSAAEQRAAPLAAGFAFRRGDIPGGATVASNLGDLQVTPKNHWPDGSLKFALIAALVDLPAATPVAMNLRRVVSSASGTPLELADLKRTGVSVTVGCGGFGTVSWEGTDWDSPFLRWVAGPIMSSWIYRRPVGSDAHLVVWLEVRVFSGGQVEVLPWVENGYIAVAGPTNKSALYTVKLNNTERFSASIDLKHHQRTPLVNGAALSHWNVADPQIHLQHDAKYLMATELVPSYSAVVSPSATVVSELPASYRPLQQGSFRYAYTNPNASTGFDRDDMSTSGYGAPIGLLPQHDMLYLVTTANTYAAVVRNGYSAGRYHIHYRDENTNRPLRFSQHPTRVLANGQAFKDNGSSTTNTRTPAASGGNGPLWDVAHSPSVGYMAYLLTGRFYFMEEVLFAATANYLGNGDNVQLRTGSQGLVQTAVGAWQTRSCAWDWRSKVQALTVVPDDDSALRNELISCVESNIAHFHGRYVAQANNPFGYILPGEAYNGGFRFFAPWQQDFVTAAFGYSLGLGLPVSSTRASQLAAFFQWKAKSVTMRLGAQGAWWYINAAPYMAAISPSELSVSSFTLGRGPWLADDAAAYAATYATQPTFLGTTEGTLAFEFQPDYSAAVRGMWANLQPALAYAVQHGVPGALEGYQRMVKANNWPLFQAQFNAIPVWSVKPSSGLVATPAWLVGKPLNEWFSIPGTSGAGGAAVDAYSGFAVREEISELACLACGGHNDSSDNRVTTINLEDNAPTWVLRTAPAGLDGSPTSGPRPIDVAFYPDGRPTSRHTYRYVHWVSGINRYVLFGARGAWGNAWDFRDTVGFDPSTNLWDPDGTWPDVTSSYGTVKDGSGNVLTNTFHRFGNTTGTWTNLAPSGSGILRTPAFYDSLRNIIAFIQWGDGFDSNSGVNVLRYDVAGNSRSTITLTGSGLSQFTTDQSGYAGGGYCPDNDKFLFYDGRAAAYGRPNRAGRMYWITPNSGTTWDIDIAVFGAGSAALPATGTGGVNGKMWYVPRLRGFVLMPTSAAGLYFLRTG
jgi:hypothetical protein